MKRFRSLLIILMVISLLIVGCGSMSQENKVDDLLESEISVLEESDDGALEGAEDIEDLDIYFEDTFEEEMISE